MKPKAPKPRNGFALAAKMRRGGPMKHRLEPRKGAKNDQREFIDELDDELLEEKCTDCDLPAKWIRHTQFAGDHFFCDEHAKKEKDFRNSKSVSWSEIK